MSTIQAVPHTVAVAFTRGDPPTMVLRIAAGMSTAAFAALTGMQVDRVEEIEAGYVATYDENVQMGRVLGIPEEYLMKRRVRRSLADIVQRAASPS
jgi:transcriptional regulator with XRE-family HTH domain